MLKHVAVALPVWQLVARDRRRRHGDGRALLGRQVALDQGRSCAKLARRIAQLYFDGGISPRMAELDDVEDDAAPRGGLHELGVDVDRVGLRSIRVFGSEIRARGGEDQADRVASMGVS